jgi:site-specific DNA recombinase
MAVLAQEAPGYIVMDVYARRSFAVDGSTIHEDEQAEECIERIEETPGWVLGKVFKDPALSAWNPKVVRPDFEEMMKRLEAGVSTGMLVWDLTRFSRKPPEGERILARAEDGIVIASLSTTYNLVSAEGRKAFRNKMNDNAYESDIISERSRRGIRLKAKRGKPINTTRGFGRDGYLPRPKREDGSYDTDALRVRVPEETLARERAAIQDAARRILSGEQQSVIAEEWNEAGLLTLNGSRWDSGTLRHMLESPSVGGLVGHKPGGAKEWKIVADNGDGPLDRETWEALMRTFSSRRRGRPAEKHLLSGILVCGECGAKMYGRPRKNHPGVREYFCQMRNTNDGRVGCTRVSIEASFADGLIEEMVVRRLSDPKHADRIAKVAAKVKEEHDRLRAERDRINGEMDSIAAKAGTSARWTADRVDAALANYEPELARVQEQIDRLELEPEQFAGVDAQADWTKASVAGRRLLIKRAFPKGDLVVTRALNSKPDTLTVDRIYSTDLEVVRN